MEIRDENDGAMGATWEARLRKVANCEFTYDEGLTIALECVEVAERYSTSQPRSMSPAVPDAELSVMVNLASALECEIRLAVYSLYHGDSLMERDEAVKKLIDCGRKADSSP